ncbi:TPA: helix-turn-helix transcriptional regulator [Staphylococcus aureus]|uniref:helix-turn-helix transcriptional regulator n=1 Tax=Staphylococcus aureus TaxID=1280 RepID=UPI000AC44D7C|nr:helix-turn-helix transcriptional regulator [Staphylococcus aureus]HBO5454944.1 helix-turn-helix transcriptional regulator [Pseudomonas aeruginosa]MBS3285563.1 helix-turn-helix transcriptional regulator [Staphylococcus aureus]MBS3293534.1 helix-turn-helix transcriptional regulator [Staphylococcus aureus]MBS3304195.1 helix-turn-helix transcriptional regulator [Staphylococcus aureus]MBS3339133.1 helix-turn-helix transcriptional regulator [Staphylococcus aureus]
MENRIRELRVRENLTQENLAEILNVSRQSISSIESNKVNPSLLIAMRIAKVFSKSVEDLFIFNK